MDIDIIKISNTIDELSYRFKKMVNPRKSLSSDYGDSGRVPLPYLKTNTTKEPFLGFLPRKKSEVTHKNYQNFPQLSKQLLVELFSSIGVSYVPEILIEKLKHEKPYDVFEKFCLTFSSQSPKIDAYELNRVILKLKEMDGYRRDNPLDTKPIYLQLSLMNFDKADELIQVMRESILEEKVN